MRGTNLRLRKEIGHPVGLRNFAETAITMGGKIGRLVKMDLSVRGDQIQKANLKPYPGRAGRSRSGDRCELRKQTVTAVPIEICMVHQPMWGSSTIPMTYQPSWSQNHRVSMLARPMFNSPTPVRLRKSTPEEKLLAHRHPRSIASPKTLSSR